MTRWRLLLPHEHGAWGFLVCGVAAALLAAPSWPGVLLAVVLALSVCVRHGLRRGFSTHNRELLQLALLVGGACVVLALALFWLVPTGWWMPLVLAAPLAGGQLVYELLRRDRLQPRSILESIAGISALAGGGGAVALVGGAQPQTAIQIAGIVAAYGACTVPYVRARLGRGTHGLSLMLHGLVLISATAAWIAGGSWAVIAIAALLALRAAVAPYRHRPTPAAAGIEELVIGIIIAGIAGYGLHG